MQLPKIMLAILSLIAALPSLINASSLNGTAGIVYATAHQIFHNGDTIRGFVRINNGFSIVQGESAVFDTFITVSGGIDLKTSGVMVLNNNMMLESGVTLTTGGIISGKNHAIFLGGDLTLSSTGNVRALHIRSNTILDGQGNTLILGDRTQLFVDDNVTLTLRNMVLRTGKVANTPPIMLSALASKLALDNVILELGSDFRFDMGQIFVHNDAIVTQTSALIYRSPRQSFITPGGTLYFDKATTFSVIPSTFTSAAFQQGSSARDHKFLVLQDASSTLHLNGCSLMTTITGFRLTKGNLFLENHVNLNSDVGQQVSSTSITTTNFTAAVGTNPQSAFWTPNGQYISVVNKNTPNGSMRILSFKGNASPTQVGPTITTASNPVATDWSPDGRYIVEINNAGSSMAVFNANGFSAPVQVGSNVSTGSNPSNVHFSRDGRFISVTITSAGGNLQIYSFNGATTPTQVGSNVGTVAGPNSADWSPDGRFLAVPSTTGGVLQIYSFDGINNPVAVGATAATGTNPIYAVWSPDGRFIAVHNQGDNTFQIFTFNGTSAPTAVGAAVAIGASTNNVGMSPLAWSPNGHYIAVVNSSDNTLQIFSFNGVASPVQVGGNVTTQAGPLSVDWSRDSNFLVITNATAGTVQVFKVAYVPETEPQACSNSIVFGDRRITNGTANLNARFLGRAHVELTGKMLDASV